MITVDVGQDPSIVRLGVFDFDVCVPADWADEQVEDFAESSYPCSDFGSWKVHGDRITCANRDGFVHISLTACPRS